MNALFDLTGKVAIVTGSSSGIGAAAVRMLADRGCNVVINYSKSETEALAAEASAAVTAARGRLALPLGSAA